MVRVRELALGRTWSIISIDSRRLSLERGSGGGGVSDRITAGAAELLRRDLGALVGPVRWRDALVLLRKVELATRRREGGRARRNL